MILSKKNFIIITIITIVLVGCDYKEINDMPMATGMAIDKVEDSYLLTAQVIAPMAAGGGASTKQIFINSAGSSIVDAVRDFVMKDGGKKVFWGHLGYVVISHKIAEENISEVLDFLIRDNDVRDDIFILIGEEGPKAENLFFDGLQEEELSFYVTDALKNVDAVSKYDPVILEDLVNSLNSTGKAIVIPILSRENVLGLERVIIDNGVVIKDGKIVGDMEGEEIRIMRLLQNKEEGGVYVIEYNDKGNKSKVSLEVDKSKTNIKIDKKDDSFYIKIDVVINAFVGEIVSRDVSIIEYDKIVEFEKQAQQEIKKKITESIKQAQKEYKADVFGFGEMVKIKYPKEYKEIEEEWHSVFSSIEFETNVKVDIEGTALTTQILKEGD